MYSLRIPWVGAHVAPALSVIQAPPQEMPMRMVSGDRGSQLMLWMPGQS